MTKVRLRPGSRGDKASAGGCVVSAVIGLAVLLFAASMVTIIVAIAIWPGEAKLTAPFLCPDDQPDPFVVADTYQVQPGESSTNFTLYCMGPRGDFTDKGFFPSFAILTAFHGVLIVIVFVLFSVRAGFRKRHAGSAGSDEVGQTQGPAPDRVEATDPSPVPDSSESETDFEPPGPIIS
jgi:hypothetical protein